MSPGIITTHHNQLTMQTPLTAAAAVTDYCRHLRTTRKSPNNASRVIWALGEFFFIYSCFLLYSNDFYRSYLGYTRKNDNNGPKVSIFLKNYSCFFIILTMFNRFFNQFQDEGTQATSGLQMESIESTWSP